MVEHRGILRVNGELAVTRTIGNRRLSRDGILSSEPDVVFIRHGNSEASSDRGNISNNNAASFLVLASDGLWDVVSSEEAVDMVQEVILGASQPSAMATTASVPTIAASGSGSRLSDGTREREQRVRGSDGGRVARGYGLYGPGQAFQVAATALTHEAYVRGSTDNIGVCVVDLRAH